MKNIIAAGALAPLAAFGQFMKAEVDCWMRVVERGGIKPE